MLYVLMAYMLAHAMPMAQAQTLASAKEVEATIKDGHSFFYFEDYEEALPLYLSALQAQPNNANLHYRIGFCYLHIAGKKHLSIKHLEAATRSMSRSYKANSTSETNAPIDALFYLGNAYFVNNQLQPALAAYQRFSDTTKNNKGSYNMQYLEHQINAIKNSKNAQLAPVDFMVQNIGGQFNDRFDNFGAAVSGDGQTLAYTSRRQFYNAVMIARRQADGSWGTPANITIDLEVDGSCHTLSLSFDGSRLYLFKEDNHDGNIFISRYNGTKWSPMKRLNRNINTQYYESHACESPDGKHLVFTSNRSGGQGDLDLYISTMLPTGEWGPAKNLGPTVNTPYNENTPFFTPSGNLLFFSSEGHSSMGGYDVFALTHQRYANWSSPINLGYPVNTPDDDVFFAPMGDGAQGLQARFGSTGYGGQDIYEISLFQPLIQRSMLTPSEAPQKQHGHLIIKPQPEKGIAMVDSSTIKSAFSIDPQMPPQLHYRGRVYSVQHQPNPAKHAPHETTSAKARTAPPAPSPSRTMGHRHALLALARGRTAHGGPQSFGRNLPPNEPPADEHGYADLIELLMLVAEPQDNGLLAKLLKNALLLNGQRSNDPIIELTRSVKSIDEQEAMVRTLAQFMDYLSNNVELSPVQRTRTIAANHALSNHDLFLNNISNLASHELSGALEQISQSNVKVPSFRGLIDILKQQRADSYYQILPELIRLMAQQGISLYNSLPDEVQHELYTKFEQQQPQSSRRAMLIGMSAAAIAMAVLSFALVRSKRKQTPKRNINS
ncbi:MAG: PD40 domain-containing protein [Bacteroidales bacterium]|nr:PD40 domain-containing protein [Bacteroidales bacterium]